MLIPTLPSDLMKSFSPVPPVLNFIESSRWLYNILPTDAAAVSPNCIAENEPAAASIDSVAVPAELLKRRRVLPAALGNATPSPEISNL